MAGVGEIKSRRLVNELGKTMKLLNTAFSESASHCSWVISPSTTGPSFGWKQMR